MFTTTLASPDPERPHRTPAPLLGHLHKSNPHLFGSGCWQITVRDTDHQVLSIHRTSNSETAVDIAYRLARFWPELTVGLEKRGLIRTHDIPLPADHPARDQ